MKRAIIIQARMTSTRLPGKVLLELAGDPMLSQQLRRLKKCQCVDEIIVATTINATDDPVVALANSEGVRWFRGSEQDVLSRYLGAARESQADIVVRITADCPLIDPEQTDRVIHELESHATECDYAANTIKRTFPRGMDAEALFGDTLERLGRLGYSQPAREHVTFFLLEERPDLFLIRSVTDTEDNSDLRWTVDTMEDMTMVRRIYQELSLNERWLPYASILKYVRANLDVAAMNADIQQKNV